MKNAAVLTIALGLIVGVSPGPAHGSTIVPSSLTGVEGNLNNAFPFDIADIGLTSQRYQQVYAASEFSGAFWIDAILFRPDGAVGDAFASTLSSVQIDFSTTSAAVDGLSTTFSANVGGDNTTVYSGSLNLSSADTGAGPRDFDILITLMTPFLYDPSLGNLLLDVRNFGGGFTTFFDAHNAGDSISRVFTFTGSDVNSLTGLADTLGLVTMFQTREVSAVPEPTTLLLLGGGLAALARRRKASARG